MDIAIVGSRNFYDLEKVRDYIRHLSPTDRIVSGHAKGPDITAEQEGQLRGLEVLSLPAEWDKYGRGAGYKRNAEIVAFVDKVVAFWDGKSKGTLHTITLAIKAKKSVEVYIDERKPLEYSIRNILKPGDRAVKLISLYE